MILDHLVVWIKSFIDFSACAQVCALPRDYSDSRFKHASMSTAIHFDAQYGLSDALLLSFLLIGLSSAPVGFVLIMWFDLLP